MKDLIKKVLREFEEFELIDDNDPYEMEPRALATFLNTFFKSNPSPRFDRTYECIIEDNVFVIRDNTGIYHSEYFETVNFKDIIEGLKSSISHLSHRYSSTDTVGEEYQDLLDTLRPLIKGNIREQANEWDWANVDDMPEPTGTALANIMEEYFKEHEEPYYVRIREINNKKAISISDLERHYIWELESNFNMENIMRTIDKVLSDQIDNYQTPIYNEFLTLRIVLKNLFDSLK